MTITPHHARPTAPKPSPLTPERALFDRLWACGLVAWDDDLLVAR